MSQKLKKRKHYHLTQNCLDILAQMRKEMNRTSMVRVYDSDIIEYLVTKTARSPLERNEDERRQLAIEINERQDKIKILEKKALELKSQMIFKNGDLHKMTDKPEEKPKKKKDDKETEEEEP